MEKVLNFLRKIGILRAGGAKGTYKDAKDAPDGLVGGDYFVDYKKKMKESETKEKEEGKASPANAPKKANKKKIIFWITVILATFLFLGSFSSGAGKAVMILVIWGVFLFFLKKHLFSGMYAVWMLITAFIIILVISLSLIGGSGNRGSGGGDLEQYVGKVYELKSEDGKFWGIVGMKGLQGGKYLEAQYNIKIKDDLPNNGKCKASKKCIRGHYEYEYANNLVEINPEHEESGEGQLSPTRCNKEDKPSDPMDYNSSLYQCSSDEYQKVVSQPTEFFDAAFTQTYSSIDDFLAVSKFEIYDGSKFWDVEEEKMPDGSVRSSGSIDTDKAVAEGKKVSEYEFTITEITQP